MTPRLNPFAAAPAPMQKWLDFGKGALQTGLEESLMELVEIRAFANHRLRCVPSHAHGRCPQAWRERGASLPARCLA